MGPLRDRLHVLDTSTATCDEPILSAELLEKLEFYNVQLSPSSANGKESCLEHWVTSEDLYRGIYHDMCKEILVYLKF